MGTLQSIIFTKKKKNFCDFLLASLPKWGLVLMEENLSYVEQIIPFFFLKKKRQKWKWKSRFPWKCSHLHSDVQF